MVGFWWQISGDLEHQVLFFLSTDVSAFNLYVVNSSAMTVPCVPFMTVVEPWIALETEHAAYDCGGAMDRVGSPFCCTSHDQSVHAAH